MDPQLPLCIIALSPNLCSTSELPYCALISVRFKGFFLRSPQLLSTLRAVHDSRCALCESFVPFAVKSYPSQEKSSNHAHWKFFPHFPLATPPPTPAQFPECPRLRSPSPKPLATSAAPSLPLHWAGCSTPSTPCSTPSSLPTSCVILACRKLSPDSSPTASDASTRLCSVSSPTRFAPSPLALPPRSSCSPSSASFSDLAWAANGTPAPPSSPKPGPPNSAPGPSRSSNPPGPSDTRSLPSSRASSSTMPIGARSSSSASSPPSSPSGSSTVSPNPACGRNTTASRTSPGPWPKLRLPTIIRASPASSSHPTFATPWRYCSPIFSECSPGGDCSLGCRPTSRCLSAREAAASA